MTSGFSARRMHPVLHTARAHRGVDYAAPSGAPVVSIAAGRVVSATFDNANGRMVRIRHASGYESYYLHLSAFAPGIRAGASISQGADGRPGRCDRLGHWTASALRSEEERRVRESVAGASQPSARRSRSASAMAAFTAAARRCACGARPGTVDACRHPLECRMAVLAPFRALRPAPSAAARVAAVPYDVVNTDEARALAAGNPLSFLHVSRAEIDLPAGTPIRTPTTVYARARRELRAAEARRAARRRGDGQRSTSIACAWASMTQTGVAACFSLDEYDRDVIKKHERTRPRQGGRPHPAHARPARADRAGVSDLSTRPRDRSHRGRASRRDAALRLHRRRTACSTRIWRVRSALTPALDRGVCRGAGALHRRRPSSCGERGARATAAARSGAQRRASGTRSSPWRFPTTRCRSCPTTGSCSDLGEPHAGRASGRAAAAVHRARTAPRRPTRRARCRCSWTAVVHDRTRSRRRLVRPRPIGWT